MILIVIEDVYDGPQKGRLENMNRGRFSAHHGKGVYQDGWHESSRARRNIISCKGICNIESCVTTSWRRCSSLGNHEKKSPSRVTSNIYTDLCFDIVSTPTNTGNDSSLGISLL